MRRWQITPNTQSTTIDEQLRALTNKEGYNLTLELSDETPTPGALILSDNHITQYQEHLPCHGVLKAAYWIKV